MTRLLRTCWSLMLVITICRTPCIPNTSSASHVSHLIVAEWGATTRLEYRGKFEVVGTMRPGRGFGEACMDGRGGRAMASVVSYTPLEVASIDRAVYQRLLWEHHERGLSLKMGALRRHPIMADLGDEDVRALAYCATTLRFPARATIVREGDPSGEAGAGLQH